MFIFKIISGFTQNPGHWNGSLNLREKVLSHLDDYSSLSIRVDYHTWHEDWKHNARQTMLLRDIYAENGEPFGVGIAAYSYGVGFGAKWYIHYLKEYGINVDCGVFADGIIHAGWHIRWWRALVGGYPIEFGDNLLAYHGFHQSVSRPMGCRPMTAPNTKCLSWNEVQLPHERMDDSVEWHKKSIQVAKELARKFVPHKNVGPRGCPPSPAQENRLRRMIDRD